MALYMPGAMSGPVFYALSHDGYYTIYRAFDTIPNKNTMGPGAGASGFLRPEMPDSRPERRRHILIETEDVQRWSMIPKLEVSHLCYSYHTMEGETEALSDLSFQVQTGEFLAVVGPSGCGKSTLLSLICGLLKPDSGRILLDGQPVLEGDTRIGYMLQKDHLFEWRTIRSNACLGLEIQKKMDPDHEKKGGRAS